MKIIYLDNLPRKMGGSSKKIDWNNSVGLKVSGVYKGIEFIVEILEYKVSNQVLTLRYLDRKFKISTGHFMECKLGNLILINKTIWDTDRWMCDLGVSEEDAKKYSSKSGRKITVKCPDCGREKMIIISNIYNNKTISCICGEGISFPEKFIINTLSQLDVDFEKEYSPKWSGLGNRRYDFYIPNINTIIEAHGIQHYKEMANLKMSLKETQENDMLKKEVALVNGVSNYITIDCRYSELEWIKSNVNKALKGYFDMDIVDFNKAEKFALKNIVKEVCECWNRRQEWETTLTIANNNRWGIKDSGTIVKYLKFGAKYGWCDYDAKEEQRKSAYKCNKLNCKKVEVFKNGLSLGVFESATDISKKSEVIFGIKLSQSKISAVCNGIYKSHKGFVFLYI